MNKAMNMIKKLWNDGGVRRMLLTFAATELVCSGLMVGVFALLGQYTPQVAVGAIVGSVLAVANFAVLSIGVEKSVEVFDREGNPAGAKLAVQLSSSVRLLVMAAVIFVLLKAGVGEPVSMILPLLFTRVGTMALGRATKTKESKQ